VHSLHALLCSSSLSFVIRATRCSALAVSYASITLRSVPDQSDLTPSDLPAREALELEQLAFSKDFKDKFKTKGGLDGLSQYARNHGEVVQTASAEISCADPSKNFKIMVGTLDCRCVRCCGAI